MKPSRFSASLLLLISPFANAQPHAAIASLPEFTTADGVTIIWQEKMNSGRGETLRLHFHTQRPFNGQAKEGVSQVLEKQLRAAG